MRGRFCKVAFSNLPDALHPREYLEALCFCGHLLTADLQQRTRHRAEGGCLGGLSGGHVNGGAQSADARRSQREARWVVVCGVVCEGEVRWVVVCVVCGVWWSDLVVSGVVSGAYSI